MDDNQRSRRTRRTAASTRRCASRWTSTQAPHGPQSCSVRRSSSGAGKRGCLLRRAWPGLEQPDDRRGCPSMQQSATRRRAGAVVHRQQRDPGRERAFSVIKGAATRHACGRTALLPSDTIGHDDLGNRLAEGCHAALGHAGATGRRLSRSRSQRDCFAWKGAAPGVVLRKQLDGDCRYSRRS
jgi:hypothetical protein